MSEKRLIQLEAAIKALTKRMEKLESAAEYSTEDMVSDACLMVALKGVTVADESSSVLAEYLLALKAYKPTIGVGVKPNP